MSGGGRHRILVTGAHGFVGRWLVAELRTDPNTLVFGVDKNGSLDVRDAGAVDRFVRDVAPTGVVHLAAIAAPIDANHSPALAWDVNVIGTFNVADACRRLCPGVRFVYVGSSEAYGQSFNDCTGPVSEAAPLLPLSTYGATKAATELAVCQMARQGLHVVVFRPFNHTGPGQSSEFVAPAFARQIALIEREAQAPVVRVGNLGARRDFLDVRDVVRAYAAAARGIVPIAPGTIINLATASPVSIRDILNGLLAETHCSIDVVEEARLVRHNEVPVASGDPTRARTLLHWTPERPLAQTLGDLLDWWRRGDIDPQNGTVYAPGSSASDH